MDAAITSTGTSDNAKLVRVIRSGPDGKLNVVRLSASASPLEGPTAAASWTKATCSWTKATCSWTKATC
ncbi:hypothetical protein [Rhodopseudomonas palustris]